MLKVSFTEFIIRGIPESLLFFLAAYIYKKNKIHLKRYLTATLLQSVIVYIIRFLPIQNAVDSILNLIVLICILIVINKFEIIKAIKVGIIITLCEFICEGINVFFLQYIMHKDLNFLFKDSMLKILYFSPSLILFGIIVIAYYIIKKKRDEYISYGKVN